MSDAGNQRDLSGLLKFCLEATKAEDATSASVSALDPERRAFLQQVLSQLATDPVDELNKAMTMVSEALNHVPDDADEDSDVVVEIGKVVDEVILDIVSNMDYANDYYKLGGLDLIQKLLASPVPILKAIGCELIAETAQNNPAAQEIILNAGLVREMCRLLDKHPDETVQVKALYAISCIVRDNEVAALKFDSEADGLGVLIRTLQKDSQTPKLRLKACFLISSLCASEETIRESLFRMGLVEQLVALLHQDHNVTHEYVASALHAIAADHAGARAECRRSDLGLEKLLRARIQELRGKEEHYEEVAFYKELLKLYFTAADGDGDR